MASRHRQHGTHSGGAARSARCAWIPSARCTVIGAHEDIQCGAEHVDVEGVGDSPSASGERS
ncbi:hypothetical protein ABZ860_33070 [Microbispora sp. NPDC046973]|uniref:hypothetical protein n=1 Tax=Microbispora sp. NPDC046973 TaxID=3155022 RepID=UPI0033D81B0F